LENAPPRRRRERASGILLAMSSLPGRQACGTLGRGAREFVDFLARAGQRWWQMLPVTPVGTGNSPYSSDSAFALDPLLIDLDDVVARGWLMDEELSKPAPSARVDFDAAQQVSRRALRSAYARARVEDSALTETLVAFRHREAAWLDDYALFSALRTEHEGRAWSDWDEGLRKREPAALARARERLADRIDSIAFEQWLCAEQWEALRRFAAARGVGLIGDVPIFIDHNSADVWAHPELFHLDENGRPTHVAGVPPDYFSATGQRWGNPLYEWPAMRNNGYAWWINRLRTQVRRFDWVRLDHFIGFVRAWAIPETSPTAESGRFWHGPGRDFFDAVAAALGELPFIAEDLGTVTPRVRRLRAELGVPGMRVLQFELGEDRFSPHRYLRNSVAYTGTHDNDTAVGWYRALIADHGEGAQRRLRNIGLALIGSPDTLTDARFIWSMIRTLYASSADTAIVPMQDVLGLGSDARMNVPGRAENNWTWRLHEGGLSDAVASHLRDLGTMYGRAVVAPRTDEHGLALPS
jgi:4-alpha-glucanotransferase